MNKRLAIFAFVTAAVLAACGGGGGSGPSPVAGPPAPTATPTPAGNLPLSEAVSGATAWVNPSSHRTLYWLDVDTATGGTCTGQCLGVWPVFAPVAGSQSTDNMTIITRSDGTGQQWAYQGHPLYTYAGDTGADQANGDNFPDFGGSWHVARPNAAAATPPPGGATPPPCHGYC
jgi:predicted lipoprotein with Yx(FWY)xxD motif